MLESCGVAGMVIYMMMINTPFLRDIVTHQCVGVSELINSPNGNKQKHLRFKALNS